MKYSLGRWIDVFLLTVVAVSVNLLIVDGLASWSEANISANVTSSPWVTLPLVVVLITMVALPLIEAGCFRLGFWRSTRWPAALRYPSIVLAMGAGSTFLFLLQYHRIITIGSFEISQADCLQSAIVVGAGIAMAAAIDCLVTPRNWKWWHPDVRARKTRKQVLGRTASQTLEDLCSNPEALFGWLSSIEPIGSTQDDLLGMGGWVDDLREALLAAPKRTIGLLGRYGAGKSSLIRMAKDELRFQRAGAVQLLFVDVATWGLKPENVPQSLLRAGVNELRSRIDTVGIGGIPEQYVRAMQSGGPGWMRGLQVQRVESPIDELKRLDNVMWALGVRLVFVVEDIDRNAPQTELLHVYAGLQSLLDQLKSCDRLSFILAVGHATFDFDRLCESKLALSAIAESQVGAVIQALRYCLLRRALDAGVVIANRSRLQIEHLRKRIPTNARGIEFASGVRVDYSLPWEAILPVLSTPRRLKSAAAAISGVWERLQGEAEIDQIIIYEVVRAACPAAIDAITDIRRRDGRFSTKLSDRHKKEFEEWKQQRIELAVANSDLEEREYLMRLVQYLCSSSKGEGGGFIIFAGKSAFVQDMLEYDVYWDRIWSGRVEAGCCDQSVLRCILQFKSGGDVRALARELEASEGAALVFERLLERRRNVIAELRITDAELLLLASAVRAEVQRAKGAKASIDGSNTMIALWRTYSNASRLDSKALRRWLWQEMDATLPTSLSLWLDIEHYWANERYVRMHSGDIERTLKRVRARCRRLWGRSPKSFIAAISSDSLDHVFALSHLIYRGQAGGVGASVVAKWRWLVPVLRAAIRRSPARVAPLLGALVLTGSHPGVPPEEGESWVAEARLDAKGIGDLIPDPRTRHDLFVRVLSSLRAADRAGWDNLVQAWVDEAIKSLAPWVDAGCPLAIVNRIEGDVDAD